MSVYSRVMDECSKAWPIFVIIGLAAVVHDTKAQSTNATNTPTNGQFYDYNGMPTPSQLQASPLNSNIVNPTDRSLNPTTTAQPGVTPGNPANTNTPFNPETASPIGTPAINGASPQVNTAVNPNADFNSGGINGNSNSSVGSSPSNSSSTVNTGTMNPATGGVGTAGGINNPGSNGLGAPSSGSSGMGAGGVAGSGGTGAGRR